MILILMVDYDLSAIVITNRVICILFISFFRFLLFSILKIIGTLMTLIFMIGYDFICVYHNHLRHLRSVYFHSSVLTTSLTKFL